MLRWCCYYYYLTKREREREKFPLQWQNTLHHKSASTTPCLEMQDIRSNNNNDNNKVEINIEDTTTTTTTTSDSTTTTIKDNNNNNEDNSNNKLDIQTAAMVASVCMISTTVSVAMIIINKAIVLDIPFSGGLVLLQNTATIFIIQSYRRCSIVPSDIGWQAILYNTPCAILFGVNTFTSMQSLTYLSVTAFTVFRNTQSILSYPLDYVIRGERLKPISIYFLFTIILGTYAYCGKDLRANIEGVAWATAHIVSTALYAILTKIRLDSAESRLKVHPLTQTLDLAWYNNVLSTPIVAAAATAQVVYSNLSIQQIDTGCGMRCWMLVAVSCFGGCAMSVTGLEVQSLISPVTFLMFNNLNKIPAMMISALIWPQLETADTTQEILGIVLSIYGGCLFALSKQGDVHPLALFACITLCIAIVPLIILGELAVQHKTTTNHHSTTNITVVFP